MSLDLAEATMSFNVTGRRYVLLLLSPRLNLMPRFLVAVDGSPSSDAAFHV